MPVQSIILPVWGGQPVVLRAVQGESGGRIVRVTLTDADGRPADLTGASVRLYVKTPRQTAVFSDGSVTDATGGACSFPLVSGVTAAAGTARCQILVAWPDNRSLKIAGLTLEVTPSNLEGAVESSDEFPALVAALNQANTAVQAAEDARQAAFNAQSAIAAVNTAGTAAVQATQSAAAEASAAETAASNADSAAQNANGAASAAKTAAVSADAAAERANTAAQNAEGVISGQLNPVIDTRLALQKNQPNGIGGLDESGKFAPEQVPEMDYVPTTRTVAGLPLASDLALTQLTAAGLASGDASGNAQNALKLGGYAASNFPQVSSGTWTLGLSGTTTAGNPVFLNRDASWIKIGKLVVLFFEFTLTSLGGMSGNIQVTGLPYPISGPHLSGFAAQFSNTSHTDATGVYFHGDDNTSCITLKIARPGQIPWTSTAADLTDTFGVNRCVALYMTGT